MSSSSSSSSSAGPVGPSLINNLQAKLKYSRIELEIAKQKVRLSPSSCSDARYWTSAGAVCTSFMQLLHTEAELGIRKWTDSGEPIESWWATYQARRIIEQIKAATLEQTLYTKQANRIERDNSPIRRAMFTTSQLGICTERVGRVAQRRSEQARFKDKLIAFYDVARRRSHRGKSNLVVALQDMATGYDFPPSFTAAAPLFPYKLPSDVLVSLFGEDVGDEIATVSVYLRNGTARGEDTAAHY